MKDFIRAMKGMRDESDNALGAIFFLTGFALMWLLLYAGGCR